MGVVRGFAGQNGYQAVRGDTGGCGGYGGVHLVYGAEGYAIKLAVGGHGLGAGGPDPGGQAKGANGFAEKGGFFVLGFSQGYL